MRSSTSLRDWRDPHGPGTLATLWAGLLGGPLVFLVLLQANYVLSYVSCETRQTWFLHALTLAGAAAVAFIGYRCWSVSIGGRRLEWPDADPRSRRTAESRAVWMAYAGAATSAWFVIVIVSMDIPVLVLRTCQ
jgi:hypothetical protein